MDFKKENNRYILRLDKGEEIISTLINFIKKQNIKLGYFIGLGAINKAEIGFFHQGKKEYSPKKFKQEFEIASLIGNISQMDSNPYIHAHIVLSDANLNTIGGHLKEAYVGATVEITLFAFESEINRKFSEEIGLNLYEFLFYF